MTAKVRFWIAGALAALALVLAGLAVAMPFLDAPPLGLAGSIATLVVAAEILAALAILVVGRELYGKLWAKLQSMRAELAEQSSKEKNHE